MESSAVLTTWFLIKPNPKTCCFRCKKKQKEDVYHAIGLRIHNKRAIGLSSEAICRPCVRILYKHTLGLYARERITSFLFDIVQTIVIEKGQWIMSQFAKEVSDVQDVYKSNYHITFMRIIGKTYNKTCKHCNAPNPIFRCSICHIARYCSETCSIANWKKHKVYCKKYDNVFLGIIFK